MKHILTFSRMSQTPKCVCNTGCVAEKLHQKPVYVYNLIDRFIFSILHFDYFKRPEDILYIQWEVRQKRSFVWQKYVLFFIFPINHLKSPQIYLTISLVVLSWSPVPYSFTSNQVCKRLMSTWFSLTKSQISPENWWKFKAIWI